MIELREADFSVEEVMTKLKTPEVGAIVSFVGVVRGFSTDKTTKVKALNYEVYKDMALKKFTEIEREVQKRFEIQDSIIIHRLNKIPVGENIVLIAVSASHRKPAFLACEFIIDELKKIVPIWKKEITEKDENWVGS